MRKLLLGDRVEKSAADVWAVIGEFAGMKKWAPIVEAESAEETPEGLVRTLTLPGGRVVKELRTAHTEHSYTYTLERPDMKAYYSTVSVVPLEAGASRIELAIEFEPAEGGDMTAATDGFLKFLGGNLKAMKRAIG